MPKISTMAKPWLVLAPPRHENPDEGATVMAIANKPPHLFPFVPELLQELSEAAVPMKEAAN